MAITAAQLRKALELMDAAELRELIQALYQGSTDNKRFLTSKLEGDNSDLFEVYLRELEKCFSPKKGELKVAPAKKAMQNYIRVASPIEALQAKIRYVQAAQQYWQKLPYWSESQDTTLANMFRDITATTLSYSEEHELLDAVHAIGQEFIKQERKFGYFDWHVRIYHDFINYSRLKSQVCNYTPSQFRPKEALTSPCVTSAGFPARGG